MCPLYSFIIVDNVEQDYGKQTYYFGVLYFHL